MSIHRKKQIGFLHTKIPAPWLIGNVGITCGSFIDAPDPIILTDPADLSGYNIGGANNIFIYKQTGSWYILNSGAIDVTVDYIPPSC